MAAAAYAALGAPLSHALFGHDTAVSEEAPKAPKNTPIIGGQKIRDFARITFEWPMASSLNIEQQGTALVVRFDRNVNPDFGPVLRQLRPYIVKAERLSDGKSIRFTLNRAYRTRGFASGTLNGVDLLKVGPSKPAAVATKAAPQKDARKMAALQPAAGTPEAPPSPEAPPAPPAPEAPADNTAPVSPPASEEHVPVISSAPETPPVAEEPPPAAPETAEEAPAALPEPAPGPVKLTTAITEAGLMLTFPWQERTAAAAFLRGRYAWIVFSKPSPLDISALTEDQSGLISGEPVLYSEYTKAVVLRIPVASGTGILGTRAQEGNTWMITLLRRPAPAEERIKPDIYTDPPLPPHVFLPVLEAADEVTITDPDIGDQLIVMPVYKPGLGFTPGRNFVEFALLPSAQGIVIQKFADDTTVIAQRNGLRISTRKGASLTANLPPPNAQVPLQQSNTQTLVPVNGTLFDYAQWKLPEKEKWHDYLQALLARTGAGTPEEAHAVRVTLAKLYLSEGLTAEALGMLGEIKRRNENLYKRERLAALSGAANFLLYRFADAANDFAAQELNDVPEIAYWRSMTAELLGKPDQYFDYLDNHDEFIVHYPPQFQQRLAVVAADRAIAAKEYNTALKIFDALQKDKQLEPVSEYVNYLMAKISVETKQVQQGVEMWKKLAEDYGNPFVRARAQFSLIVEDMKDKDVDKDRIIDRLERLVISWRGDNLELNALSLLGDLYEEKQDWPNALRVWNDINVNFANTEIAVAVSRKMLAAFNAIFAKGETGHMTPMEQLALYYAYKDLTPTDASGDIIIRRLADKLIAVDLLEEAATVLEQRINYRFERKERSETGALLAHVYILNNKPEDALRALQSSVYGDNPPEMQARRDRLSARALFMIGQHAQALQTIANDKSPEADTIRIDIYWAQKNWPEMIATIESILRERTNFASSVTQQEGDWLVRLSLAYIMEGDTVQLQYLRDYFGPLMQSHPQKDVFAFLTSPDLPVTVANVEAILQQMDVTRDFLKRYKTQAMSANAVN